MRSTSLRTVNRSLPVMAYTVIAAFLVGSVTSGFAFAQSNGHSMPQSIQVDVVYLSSDVLEGRGTGTEGERLASEYIAERFKELGLASAGADGWFQPFEYTVSANPHATEGEGETKVGRNVVGFLDNGASTSVVIGAHFDHLGFGGIGSREPGVEAIHNGADDNASGVAGMLEIARQLLASSARNNNYVFVAFSGEELGLYGSKYFVSSPIAENYDFNYMINLDMVGRLSPERAMAVNGSGTSPSFEPAMTSLDSDLVLNFHQSGLGPSDHAAFYLADMPVIHFFTGQHEDYHKPTDDSNLVNYSGIYDVASFSVDLIEALDDEGRLQFQKTQDEQQTRSSFNVSLGIMPDYVSSGSGVRVDAVMDGRPGALAGLEKGDIIVRLGDVVIADINNYMEALSQLQEGETTTIVVRRGDEELEKTVSF